MDNSREIYHLMYFDFSFLCEYEEELKSSIFVCVHTLFCDLFSLLEHEHFSGHSEFSGY
jgi:hypothetical protein